MLSAFGGEPGTVYLVVGSDTAIWNYGTTVDVYTRHPHYSQQPFTDPSSPVFQIMKPAWRDQFKDSFGQPIKFTWWLMGGNIYRDADNVNVPIANTMVPYLMKKYHGDAIRQFGDELSLHYHTFLWSDYTGEGTYYWNQSETFNECREDFDYTLAQYLLECGIFPVSFRSGWHFMDNDWQSYLNELIPYCMHDNWPAWQPWHLFEPINNVQDWSHAPSVFIPYHPSTNDYQIPGDGSGWNLRSIKMQSMAQSDMNAIFSRASNGVDEVACIWSHLPESFAANVARIDHMAHAAGTNYPGVQFRYCTAIEGMQRWLRMTNLVPPNLDVQESSSGSTVTLTIQSSTPLFQPKPFVAMRDAFQHWSNITSLCEVQGSNTWTITLPCPRYQLAKVGIAATDIAGNLTTRIIRYLPDDLYLDNLDPEYSESGGPWQTFGSSAWGVDARVSQLASGTYAQAEWRLPVTRSGFYSLAVQVPFVTNAAANIVFNAIAGSSSSSVVFTNGLPPLKWIALGTVFLNDSLTNRLDMLAPGTNQGDSRAVADVIRVSPVAGPPSNTLSAVISFGALRLQYAGKAGTICQLEQSVDLTNWLRASSMQLSETGTGEFLIRNSQPSALFYRVKQN